MTHLFRGTLQGEILDTDGKVVGRIVPVEPTEEMIRANLDCQDYDPEDPAESEVYCLYRAMLSAAPTDWSAVAVKLPERVSDEDRDEWAIAHNNVLDEIDEIIGAKK